MSNRMITQEEASARFGQIASRIPGFAEYNDTGIEPLHDRILVKRIPDTTESRIIIIPDIAKTKTRMAKVLAVGPGAWRDGEFYKTAVKPGDVVILPGIAATMPDWEEHDTILIQEGDVGGILG